MAYVNERECKAAGKDPRRVKELADELYRISVRMKRMGVYVFGGSGSGSIRAKSEGDDRPLILAGFSGYGFDGGDGAEREDGDGLLRGE